MAPRAAGPYTIVQYDTRKLTPTDLGLINRIKHYCKKWGYVYRFISSGYEDTPPFWAKVKVVRDILATQDTKGVLWLDTDATIFDLDISLDSFLQPGKSFYKATDPTGNNIFNAGVWLVLNNPRGKRIMDDWIAQYKPDRWYKQETGDWDCPDAWAGNSYEQGSFAHKVVPVFQRNIKTVEQPFFQATSNVGRTESPKFILHFYNIHKINRKKFLERNPLPMLP